MQAFKDSVLTEQFDTKNRYVYVEQCSYEDTVITRCKHFILFSKCFYISSKCTSQESFVFSIFRLHLTVFYIFVFE